MLPEDVISPEDRQNLDEFLAGLVPLKWPVPKERELAHNLRIRLMLETHRGLFGYQKEDSSSSGSSSHAGGSSSSGAGGSFDWLSTQRPEVKGQSAELVSVEVSNNLRKKIWKHPSSFSFHLSFPPER